MNSILQFISQERQYNREEHRYWNIDQIRSCSLEFMGVVKRFLGRLMGAVNGIPQNKNIGGGGIWEYTNKII